MKTKKASYKILKSGLYQINKRILTSLKIENDSIENTFKKTFNINDINIIKLVKENKYYYYFNITQLF